MVDVPDKTNYTIYDYNQAYIDDFSNCAGSDWRFMDGNGYVDLMIKISAQERQKLLEFYYENVIKDVV